MIETFKEDINNVLKEIQEGRGLSYSRSAPPMVWPTLGDISAGVLREPRRLKAKHGVELQGGHV